MNHIRYVLLFTLVLLAGCGPSPGASLPAPTQAVQIPSPIPVTKPPIISAVVTPVVPAPHPGLPTVAPKAPQPIVSTGRVIYTRSFNEQGRDGQSRSELWSINVDGSDNHKLFACPGGCRIDHFTVAPDNAWIAYSAFLPDERLQLRVAHLDGTDDHMLLDTLNTNSRWGTRYTFAPDSTRIAFLRSRRTNHLPVAEEEVSLWIVATRGGEPHQIVDWGASIGPPFWSDNTHLLYTDGAIRRVPAQSGAGSETVFQGWIASLSTDRKALLTWLESTDSDMAIAYEQPSTFGIVLLEGSAARLVKTVRFPAQPLAWSPDKTMIAQTISGNVELIHWQDDIHEILTHYQSSRHQVTKTRGEGVVGEVAWTMDSRGLLYGVEQPDTPGTLRLQYYNLTDGSEQTLIEQFGGNFVIIS
jgi:hypothetical protein